MCVAALCAVGVLAGLVAWYTFWRIFLILFCFLFPSLCGGCVCIRGSCETSGVDCGLDDVSNTMLFSVPQCVQRLYVHWGF